MGVAESRSKGCLIYDNTGSTVQNDGNKLFVTVAPKATVEVSKSAATVYGFEKKKRVVLRLATVVQFRQGGP